MKDIDIGATPFADLTPERQMQGLFTKAPIGIFITTPEGRFISANMALARMFGYDGPDDLIAAITDLATQLYAEPADREAFQGLMREQGELCHHECRFRRRDGTEFWGALHVRALHDEQGRIVAYQGFMTDQTEARQTSEKLQQLEWMLSGKAAAEQTAAAEGHDQGYGDLTALNRGGLILRSIGRERLQVFVNEYLELLGTSAAIYEANGDYAYGIFSSGWCRMMDCASRKLCETSDDAAALSSGRWLCHESCWTDCSRRVIAEGTAVDIACHGGIRLYAVPIVADGKVVGAINCGYGDPPTDPDTRRHLAELYHLADEDLVCAAKDYQSRPPFIIELAKKRLSVTAQLIGSMIETQQAAVALREERERIEYILSITGTGIDIVDSEFNLHYVDKGWQLIHGDPSDRKCYEYFQGLKEPCPGCGIPKALKDKQVVVAEEVLRRENNRVVEVHTIPFQNAEGQWLVAEFNVDITARKRVQQEHEELQAHLAQVQKMEAIGQLAGGIAHDFNNQLTGVLGFADLLHRRLDDPGLKGYVERIIASANRGADLTQQLLAFSRKGQLQSIPVDMHRIINDTVEMLEHALDKRIRILRRLEAQAPKVLGDPSQLQNALLNLALNARDAMAEGGDLTFTTSLTTLEARSIPGFGLLAGSYLVIGIEDSGTGMSAELQAHIFEPFFTTKEPGKGTGMGLASVFGTVTQHQGAITVYSEPGHGSTFRLYLPLAEARSEVPASDLPPRGLRANLHVLVVDDEGLVRELLQDMLTELGHRVETADDGHRALERYQQVWQDIDLVILDMIMPGLDGCDTFRAMKAINPAIRAILASGYSLNERSQSMLAEGVLGFVQKPFIFSELQRAVECATMAGGL